MMADQPSNKGFTKNTRTGAVGQQSQSSSSSLLEVLASRGCGAEPPNDKDNDNDNDTGGGEIVLVLDGGVSTHLEAQWGHRMMLCCKSSSGVIADEGVVDGASKHDEPQNGTTTSPREEPKNCTASSREEEEEEDGAAAGGCFVPREMWSSAFLLTPEGRNAIRSGHKDWIQAGANVVSTVTYQLHNASHLWPLELKANPSLLPQLWMEGVRLAREAIEDATNPPSPTHPHKVWVVASLGCYGAALANGAEYTGNYGPNTTIHDLKDFHAAKLEMALAAHPDALVWETIPSLLECQALARLLLQKKTGESSGSGETAAAAPAPPPVAWVSLACRDDGAHLNDGTPLEHALEAFDTVPLTLLPAIGFNCGHVKAMPFLVERYLLHSIATTSSSRPRRALALYPNSGEEWDAVAANWVPTTTNNTNDGEVDDTDDATTASSDSPVVRILWQCVNYIRSFERKHQLPAVPIVVGGCCRTTIDEISSLRRRADHANVAAVTRRRQRSPHECLDGG